MQKVNAKTLAGFMELEPAQQIVFNKMKRKIREVFEKNGLSPMDTPILEYSEILLAKAGGETEKQIYRFNKGETDLCMRFDLTVPFAKYCAINQNILTFPFRRYQIGKVFRGERVQKGRLREFYQCDMDIISDAELSLMADAECVSVMSQIFESLEQKVKISISNRKILVGFLEELNLQNNLTEILILLDKKDKIGREETIAELSKITNKAKEILEISEIKTIAELEKLKFNNQLFQQGITELTELFRNLQIMNVANDNIVLDLSIIRGLDYYTGTVFEAVLENVKEKVSVGGGGRYENLASNFTDKKLVGVGVSIGLSRLFDILDKNNLLEYKASTTAQIAIIPLGETLKECFEFAKIFRDKDIKAEVLYFDKPFKQKMQYANKIGVPFITVIGENEIKNEEYGLKNMSTGEVFQGSLTEIIAKLGEANDQ